jgi:hypothetical protein
VHHNKNGLKRSDIRRSVKIARKNWDDWKCVFEHTGALQDNPLLANPDLFREFLRRYYVGRTIRKANHEAFRLKLSKSKYLVKVIADDSGKQLDHFETRLRAQYGTHQGRNRITSVLSKVAAFLRPECFVAWDRYAKKGLKVVRKAGQSSNFDTYSEYLKAFKETYEGPTGQAINTYINNMAVKRACENEPRFQWRVLDAYLMICGGREFNNFQPTPAPCEAGSDRAG